VRWQTPAPQFLSDWARKADETRELALLARVDFQSPREQQSFTLELFYRAPDLYLLRGRGTLGVTGFRARVRGDSLTVLLDREKRGYTGLARDYPDRRLAELWQLLHRALPWLVGSVDLEAPGEGPWQVQTTERGTRPERLEVTQGERRFLVSYGRYRDQYPYWHLREAVGSSPGGHMKLDFRQQLYNSGLDSTLFLLQLPPGTRPLAD
jgi:hypothetical protein